jgi:hypothetical protein
MDSNLSDPPTEYKEGYALSGKIIRNLLFFSSFYHFNILSLLQVIVSQERMVGEEAIRHG